MKKIRGNKRRIKKIENWRINNLKIDLDYPEKTNKDYVKIRIFPWNPVAMSIHNYPNPKGKIRKKIIESFFDIYESWNIQLKELGKPFYLKIWLFEPNIYDSQVVCAINDKIEYYENIFYKPKIEKNIAKSHFEKISNRLNNFNWSYSIEEYPIFENEYLRENFTSEKDYLEEQKCLKRELKKPYREINQVREGIKEKLFLIKGSEVWLGEK
ncbi:hypothetical protein C3L50_03680 [Flavobacterium alvei]|uniref:Uncharacterized protein n=1 Tax=Flavobacterium alvei TaxID=2080416 RepID=A0A2S5AEH3_9FLAO|nr:hypothetical protein [Flavobacterium alvei]POY40607.1 hypothetical protein C3L50_03680 [Flavobacterium alvei]